ncbi:hypothetical protein ILUMI_17173, partial [Ignelater luminosus]
MARTSIVPPQVKSQHQDIRDRHLDSSIKEVVENQFRYRTENVMRVSNCLFVILVDLNMCEESVQRIINSADFVLRKGTIKRCVVQVINCSNDSDDNLDSYEDDYNFSAPLRLQRMLMKIQRYDIELHYVSGKYLYLADTLSRTTSTDNKITESEDKFDEEVEAHVGLLRMHLNATDHKVMEIQKATSEDT